MSYLAPSFALRCLQLQKMEVDSASKSNGSASLAGESVGQALSKLRTVVNKAFQGVGSSDQSLGESTLFSRHCCHHNCSCSSVVGVAAALFHTYHKDALRYADVVSIIGVWMHSPVPVILALLTKIMVSLLTNGCVCRKRSTTSWLKSNQQSPASSSTL